jgi:hypothetical protein
MSRRSRRLSGTVAGALAVSALAAPAAGALPCEAICGSTTSSQTRPPTQTTTRVIDNGFDWGSAGLGAGGGAAIVLLSLGGVRAGSRAFARPAGSAAKSQP